jgi:hypothetical protein
MLAEIALVLLFQARFGILYRAVGGLFAAYMAGLAAGSAASAWMRGTVGGAWRTLVWLRLGMLCLCAVTAETADAAGTPALVTLLAAFAFLFGAEYPVANRLYIAGEGGHRGAGLLYGLDTAGAALGVVAGGTLLLPLLGVVPTMASLVLLHAVLLAALGSMLFQGASAATTTGLQ